MRSPWLYLAAAGAFEVAWAVGLEYADGFSNPRASVATVVALVASMLLLARAVEQLPVGTAYAVWTGIGAVGTALAGVALFDEPADPARVAFVALVVAGVAGLKITA